MKNFVRFSLKPLSLMLAAMPLAVLAQDAKLGEVVITAPKDAYPSGAAAVGAESLLPCAHRRATRPACCAMFPV